MTTTLKSPYASTLTAEQQRALSLAAERLDSLACAEAARILGVSTDALPAATFGAAYRLLEDLVLSVGLEPTEDELECTDFDDCRATLDWRRMKAADNRPIAALPDLGA